MGKTLYLECESGISGDMTVAALLDLGADQQVLKKALASLPVQGFDIRISRVKNPVWMRATLMWFLIRNMKIMIMIWNICMVILMHIIMLRSICMGMMCITMMQSIYMSTEVLWIFCRLLREAA